MNVLFLPKYGRKAASARYRYLQFYPCFERAGIRCTVSPLLADRYLEHRFATGGLAFAEIVKAYVQRVFAVLNAGKFDLVVLSYEVAPYLPPVFERYLIWRGIPYIYDYDDATFHSYDINPSRAIRVLFKDKIATVISGAAMVFAGSPYLADYARKYCGSVHDIPTVIDLELYPEDDPLRPCGTPLKIGWIGSPSTAAYLKPIELALRRFCAAYPAQVILVGAGAVSLDGFPKKEREWSEATEVADVADFDIGIMPLVDTPWARGKCAFKLIQYMGCARPVIATPVGMNSKLVAESGAGFLAETEDDWVGALTRLHCDYELRKKMGAAGRIHVAKHYSLQALAPKLQRLLSCAAGH